jgi:CRISPR-associated protein Csd1
MMLQALIAYAERENLGDADFETVGVRWLVPLDLSGKLAGGPILLAENPDEKKPRAKQMVRPFTSPNDLNQGTKSHFLCDTLERAALLLDAKAPEKAQGRGIQHDYFKSLMVEAADHCPSESRRLNAVVAFLNDPALMAVLHRQLIDSRAKPSDNCTFAVDGAKLLDSEALKQFWRRRRAATSAAPRTPRICIATGEPAETLDTTEKVKGVPGGLATGTNLISFDKDSFCSFGLEQAQNAALSAPAELKIRSALNSLIQKSRNQRLVINETVHLHWSRKQMAFDPIDPLLSGDPEQIARLLASVQRGQQVLGLDADAYYCLSLSGNGARIVVRDWFESTVPEAEQHVAEWFHDLAIVPPEGVGLKQDFKFGALLYALVRADVEELPPQLPTQLLHGAFRGRSVPLPQSALAAALRRQQVDQDKRLNPARIALIKACLLRSPNLPTSNYQPLTTPMTESLNSESRDPAYLCGRLFAVFDRLQYLALGGVNAGVVERYYASASTTPALVMGRLFRNAQFHLAKTEGGVATNVAKDFEAITCALGDQFPATLDLEGQGRFALGYYHQKAEYRRRTIERKEQQAQEAATE